MKIGVFSDSHDHIKNLQKAVDIFNEREIPIVIHCGDVVSPFISRIIANLNGRFYGVFGNNDGERVGLVKFFTKEIGPIVGQVFEKEIDGKKVIAFHGDCQTPSMIKALAESGKFDVILSGHTHQLVNKKIGECLVINPGELCGYLTGNSTFAIIDLEKLEAEIIYIERDIDHI